MLNGWIIRKPERMHHGVADTISVHIMNCHGEHQEFTFCFEWPNHGDYTVRDDDLAKVNKAILHLATPPYARKDGKK